jgi:hypothetical protein
MEIKIPYNSLKFQPKFRVLISEDSEIDTQIISISKELIGLAQPLLIIKFNYEVKYMKGDWRLWK